MDYRFFQALTSRVDQASGAEQQRLSAVRARITELIDLIQQRQEAAAQEAVQVLQDILDASSVEEGIQRNVGRINDTFMMVLAANIQAAEERKDLMASARLKQVRDTVMKLIQNSAPPELQFVSSLLQVESLDEAQKLIDAQAGQYGPAILELMDALLEDLEARGILASASGCGRCAPMRPAWWASRPPEPRPDELTSRQDHPPGRFLFR
jgi:hypothetical protein